MLNELEERLHAVSEARASAVALRVEEAVRAEVPGVAVDREAGRVTLSERGLRRRAVVDARLRWIGGYLK